MSDLDDFQLDRSGTPQPEHGPQEFGARLLIVSVVVLAILVAGYVWWARRPRPTNAADRTGAAQVRPAVAAPERVAPEQIDLPPLDRSDGVVRQLVERLSSHPEVMRWLATNQLIRNFALVVTNIADGRTPEKYHQAVRPAGRFVVARDERGDYIDPASYRRYDGYADAVAGLDPAGTARVYETLKPRIQEAYDELGKPEGGFDAALKHAIVLLLQTPVVEGRLGVTGRAPLFAYADERLESLAGAQRQLLRMGPRNERLVQEKLRAIAPLLGIAPQDLPPAHQAR